MSQVLATSTRQPKDRLERAVGGIDAPAIKAFIGAVLNRHPCVGLAVGVIRDGHLDFFGHGVTNIASPGPITKDTVFRIGSITKTFTAVAVMQLWERGLVDLDAPANHYLRAYQLVPAQPGFGPVTLRHLLTHTAGIPEVLHFSDLLHPRWGPFDARPAIPSVEVGQLAPSLAEYYLGGLRVVVEPGTALAYTNHGFATLGQLVEDVSGKSLDRYFRAHIFEPLGMDQSDLIRTERITSHLATGYALGANGTEAIPDREWLGAGAGQLYSTTADLTRFAAALLEDGVNQNGSILQPATLATMYEPHYQPDPRVPGMGLGFFRSYAGGHLVVGHEGVLPGFNSLLSLAPDDGVGLIALTNGSSGAFFWLQIELGRLLRRLLDVPDENVRTDLPHHPEIWHDLCGRYELPAKISDLRGRMMIGAGAQVMVRRGRLMLRILSPIPALYRGLPLYPDDESDPFVFRLDLSRFGMGTTRLVFGRTPGLGTTALHLDLQSLSLHKSRKAVSHAG